VLVKVDYGGWMAFVPLYRTEEVEFCINEELPSCTKDSEAWLFCILYGERLFFLTKYKDRTDTVGINNLTRIINLRSTQFAGEDNMLKGSSSKRTSHSSTILCPSSLKTTDLVINTSTPRMYIHVQ